MEEIDALEKSIVFYNTPATIIIDALGRNIIAVSSNQLNNAGDKAQPIDWTRIQLSKEDIDPSNPNLLVSWQSFDIQGRTLLQADPRFMRLTKVALTATRSIILSTVIPLRQAWLQVGAAMQETLSVLTILTVIRDIVGMRCR